MVRRFQDKTALITGGAGAIGFAVAERLTAEGARVVLLDRLEDRAMAAAEKLPGAQGFGVDVSDSEAVAAVYEMAEGRMGPIHHIVSVAGQMIYKNLEEITPADWSTLIGVNFLSAAYLTSLAFGRMPTGGSMVFVSSIHAWQTSARVGPYAASKAALNSLARTASIEGQAKGLRVNGIAPGAIDTPMLRESPNIKAGLEVLAPADVGLPEDIAAAAAFLLSDEARFITGETLRVDGGRLAKL